MNDQLKAIGYVRVSTEDQSTNGVSLDAQEEKIRAYCIAKEWQLIRIIRDEGFSAKNLNRPGAQEIIAGCNRRDFDILVIFKLDRLTRSVKDLCFLVEDIFQKSGIAFASIQDGFDSATANGRLLMNILGTLSQWERDIISERTKDSMQYMKRNLRLIGAVPYGFNLLNGELHPNHEELKVVQLMVTMRQKGKSYWTISAALNAKETPTKNAGTWSPKVVRGILKSFSSLPGEHLVMQTYFPKGFPKLPRDVRDIKKKGAR